MRIDAHQHLWTEPLVAALARRTSPPRVLRRDGGWWLEVSGEVPSLLPAAPDDTEARAALVGDDGAARALVALSSALGAERLPAGEAHELIAAYDAGVATLPDRFGSWGALALHDAVPASVDAILGEGHVGLCLPADALATPAAVERLGPVLERLQAHDAPLFVHPVASGPVADAPTWWPALTGYVASLHAAWHAWVASGRASHPRLRVLFAALAGMAPLHAERLAARGGPAEAAHDALAFYDTSSYGPVALAAMRAAVGPDALVHGSDRPYAEPPPSTEREATVNAARMLTGAGKETA
jgi:6-methylsalicylate decarboxylase